MPDLSDTNAQGPTAPQNNGSNELAHITEEIYKKNAELTHTNKVLSLLRKIDDIVLSSVTDIKQVAQQVVDWVVKEDSFKIVSILIINKKDNSLYTLAVSQVGPNPEAEQRIHQKLIGIKIPLENSSNGVMDAVKDKREHILVNFYEVYSPFIDKDEAKNIEETFVINSTVIYPLIVREVVIGVMIISRIEGRIELSLYEKDLIDRLASVVGIAMDNSMMYKEVAESNEKLKELDHLKDEFISVTSHELRTPMTIIKNYVWRVLNDPNEVKLSDKNIERLKRVYESTEREIVLVNDILDVSKLESGAMAFSMEDFDIVSFCKEVREELSDDFSKKRIQFSIQEQPSLIVHADKNRVRQIVLNLLTNAYKFSFEDGHINISFEKTDKFINTTVSDKGMGIKEEDIPKLFAKFGRLDSPLSPNYQTTGTGLGLYLCKKLAERSGGKISVRSVYGKGSDFTFSLPIA